MINFDVIYRINFESHIQKLNLSFEDIKILKNQTLKESKDINNKRRNYAFQEFLVFNQLYNKKYKIKKEKI